MKDLYTKLILRLTPRVLTLVDRNPNSKTYGCSDRNFWHYKTADMPSCMAQLYPLGLALLYKTKFKGNIYYKKEKMREWAIAGIKYAAKSSRKDGDADEFFPFERPFGSLAISLVRLTEAYLELGLKDKELVEFFKKRADWIIKHPFELKEKCNHFSATALACENIFRITGGKKYDYAAKRFFMKVLQMQTNEGWFLEDGGADYGYQSINLSFLAHYYLNTKDVVVFSSIQKGIKALLPMVKEYKGCLPEGSRGCTQFAPSGFYLMRKEIPAAREILKHWKFAGCVDNAYVGDELQELMWCLKS